MYVLVGETRDKENHESAAQATIGGPIADSPRTVSRLLCLSVLFPVESNRLGLAMEMRALEEDRRDTQTN